MFGVKEIDAAGLQALLIGDEMVRLIDVRTAAEFNQGIIEGGEFMPLHAIPLRMSELETADNEKLVIYCRSGNRSAQACMYLQQNSGIEAINLQGGIIQWYRAGHAVVAPPQAVA